MFSNKHKHPPKLSGAGGNPSRTGGDFYDTKYDTAVAAGGGYDQPGSPQMLYGGHVEDKDGYTQPDGN